MATFVLLTKNNKNMEKTNTTTTATINATANLEERLKRLLAEGAVRFSFEKRSGEIRHAIGTRNLSVASKATGRDIPAPKSGYPNPTAYYDLEKDAWRSWSVGSILSIEE
jgi:hypothetical protein